MADTEDDPYAVSSDSEDEDVKKPPPKIAIEGRASDLSTLKAALASEKEVSKDQTRVEEVKAVSKDLSNLRGTFECGNTGIAPLNNNVEPKPEREKLTAIDKEKYSQFKDKFEKLDETLEQNLEEKRKAMEREIHGAGIENLSKAKDRFEKPQEEAEIVREAVDIQRSDADKKRVQKAFNKKNVTEEEVPKECVICGKIVYPVEKVFANKRLYHKACFKCVKCNKSLTATNFNSHEGTLLCKVHMLEVFHPELAKSMDPNQIEEDEHGEVVEDEEGDYAVVSKPKVLDSSVVRSGLKSADDLASISSLRDKKGSWETSVQESQKIEKKSGVDGGMFEAGKVKSHQTKFTEGGSVDEPEDEEDDSTRDPNVIRENRRRKKEELHFEQVGDLKNKWKTGEVEAAQEMREDRSNELDELKKGLKVKERFQEKTGDQTDSVADRQSVVEKESIDTSWPLPAQEHPVQAFLTFLRKRYVSVGTTPPPSPCSPISPTSAFVVSSEARKAFLQGAAFESGPVEKTVKDDIQFSELGSFKERFEKGPVDEAPTEKTAVDVRCAELGNIKAAFEKGDSEMTPEDRADEKKKQIEAEFTRYKLARRKQELREERERQETGDDAADKADGPADVRSNAEVGSIKERFEQGTAFKSDEPVKRRPEDEIEIKVAGKARQKFKEIDADGPLPIRPTMQSKPDTHISKWGKDKDAAVPEAINKRVRDDTDDQDDDEGAFEVKALMNKFKNIGKASEETDMKPKPRKQFTPPPEGYQAEIESSGRERDPNVVSSGAKATDFAGAIAIEAKELKARFEGKAAEDNATETVEEKRKRLAEEFKKYKELKEIESQNEPSAPEEPIPAQKEEIQVTAEHASKMAAKWEKIQKKEAKKAQKSMPQKSAQSVSTPPAKICFACSNKVYMAERLECDGMLCHRMCFRCKVCLINLRVENYARGPDGIYCKNHHKERFNDMSKSAFVYSATREFICSA